MFARSRYLIVLAIAVLSFFFAQKILGRNEIAHAPGILVSEAPQQMLTPRGRPWEWNGYQFTPLARYQLRARILGIERYRFGRESEISPYDLALGWGPMSDQGVLEQLEITQRNRWYYWEARTLPLPKHTLIASSANTHIIPANDDVAKLLGALRVGEIVALRGQLVAIKAQDGWQWRSSLSRDDTGLGACELLWVEEIELE